MQANNEELATLASRLRSARKSASLTQKEVAIVLQRSAAAISTYESVGVGNAEPSISDLKALAALYKVSAGWLLGITSESHVSTAEGPPIITVPLLPTADIATWDFSNITTSVQANFAFPPGVGAAFEIKTNAMGDLCTSGDIAIVERAHVPIVGKVYALVEGNGKEPTLRRCEQDGSTTLYVADDRKYPTLFESQVRVIGRVVEIVKHIII